MIAHIGPNPPLSRRAQVPTAPKLGDERLVVEGQFTEPRLRDSMSIAEGENVLQQMRHGAVHRLDETNRQGWSLPTFRAPQKWWIYPTMASDIDINSIREQLQRIMERKGVKPTTLSLRIGNNKALIKQLMEDNDDVRLSTLSKIAGALEITLDELLARPRVPVAGYIGAGGSIDFEGFGEDWDGAETVVRPPVETDVLIALIVRGDSMFPKYRDGDVIYISRNHEGVRKDYIGEDCAVRTVDGGSFLKTLAKGSRPGTFTLRSLNAPDMEDVQVEWATPILFVMPVRSRDTLGNRK